MRFLAVVFVLCAASTSGVIAESLGDAAKKQKERRKSAATAHPQKVYGEADLQRYQPVDGSGEGALEVEEPAPARTPERPATPEAPSSGGRVIRIPKEPSPSAPSGMDALRSKTEHYRRQYRQLKEAIDALERHVAQLRAQGYDVAGAVLTEGAPPRGASEEEKQKWFGRQLCQRKVMDLEGAKEKLAGVVEAARRQGVPSAQLE